jgi:hypothetical protein
MTQYLNYTFNDRLIAKEKSPGPIYDTMGFTYTVTPFDVEGMKRELELMFTKTEIELLYHTMLALVDTDGDEIKSITICTKAGLGKLYV